MRDTPKISPIPHSSCEQDFGADRPIGPIEKGPLQDLLDQLGMNLHSRNLPCYRCRLAIVDHAGRRGSDQHDVVGKERRIEIPRENVSRRDEAVGPWRRVI